MSGGKGFNILEAFPLLTEFIADTGIGYLIILFLYPFAHFLTSVPIRWNYEDLVTVFDSSGVFLSDLSYVSIFVAFIIGIASREPLWLIWSFFRKSGIEKCVAYLAYRTLEWEVGRCFYKFEKVEKYLIDKNPFWRVGQRKYADFRANLVCKEGELQKFRGHWIHEEFMWLQFRRLYSFGLTFLFTYFVYSLFVVYNLLGPGESLISLSVLGNAYVRAWIAILLISLFITFGFYREYVFHGIAFVTVNELLFEKFRKSK